MRPNQITGEIIGAAIEVHRELGPGKAEIAYETALVHELELRGLVPKAQKPVPVVYKGVKLECGYRLDLLVAERVVVEIKSVDAVIPVHRAQVLTYLKLGGWKLALLLNFNVAVLKAGIERFVLGFDEDGAQATPETNGGRSADLPSSEATAVFQSFSDCGDPKAEELAREVISAAMEVHRELGPGLLPSTYDECLCHELHLRGLEFERKRPLALHYKGRALPGPDEVMLLIGGRVIVNACALTRTRPVHENQLLSQLRLGRWRLGLLINFNTPSLVEGLRRLVLNETRTQAPRERKASVRPG
jgi:GxxExxY protein